MLANSKFLLEIAKKQNYAIPHANLIDQHTLKGIIKTCDELQKPIIVGWAEAHTPYITMEEAAVLTKYYSAKTNVPVVLHLDHGSSFETVKKAIDFGFTSVMFDGSMLPFHENVEKSREIVAYAHQLGVTVESELGHVGNGSDYELESAGLKDLYTKPEEAAEFIKLTGVDSLAVAIGTAHGEYVGTPEIDYVRLAELRKAVDIPLVLHGSSGTGLDKIAKCIDGGINKVNICTDLLKAAQNYLKEWAPTTTYDELSIHIEEAVKDCLKEYYKALRTI